jgi:hypothetical protein
MTLEQLVMTLTRQQLQLTEQVHALTQAISLMAQTNQMLVDAMTDRAAEEEGDVGLYMDGSRQ